MKKLKLIGIGIAVLLLLIAGYFIWCYGFGPCSEQVVVEEVDTGQPLDEFNAEPLEEYTADEPAYRAPRVDTLSTNTTTEPAPNRRYTKPIPPTSIRTEKIPPKAAPYKRAEQFSPRTPPANLFGMVNFQYGSAALTSLEQARQLADQLAADKRWQSNKYVLLTGYTCNIGLPQQNMNLGQRRANVLKTLLIRRGVPAELIKVDSEGEQEPLVSNNAGKREQNRRVELVLVPK